MSDDALDTDDETYSAIRTILGSTHRTARWHLTDEVDVLTALGRSSFDLRLVETSGRPTAELSVTCVLGTVTLVVPPGTLVVLDGTSFLARAACDVEPGPESNLPRIEVTATTVLGRVRIISCERDTAVDAVVADHDGFEADRSEPGRDETVAPVVDHDDVDHHADPPVDGSDAEPLAS